jgi:hypothetical protein
MTISSLDLKDYAALRRSRFYVDEEGDAEWYFGNQEVEQLLISRLVTDIDVRGVPKCGVVGRFGIGKTHTLNHLKWLMENGSGPLAGLRPFKMDLPWDETNREMSNWRFIHARMLDVLGEPFIREIVRALDASQGGGGNLEDIIYENAPFGDENLRRSLATVLVDYFKREVRKTYDAWQWLKAEKSFRRADDLGVTKLLADSDDMVHTILNLGSLSRKALDKAVVFLFDEAQNLGNVRRADTEVHRAFLRLAGPENKDVGFVLAIFGGGLQNVPKVLTTPSDILSRLGVTAANLNEAFVELHRVVRSKQDISQFMRDVLNLLVDQDEAKKLITDNGIKDVTADQFPFTDAALIRLEDALFQKEESRNPRIIIDRMAICVSKAYQRSKMENEYIPVTDEIAAAEVKSL